jgi:glycolate oxidase
MINSGIKANLIKIVGESNYLDSNEDRITYSYDGTPILTNLPDAIIRPGSVKELSKIVKIANEEKISIVPRGSGTGLSGGSIPVDNSIVISLNHWKNILEIDEANLTISVEPGVVTGRIHSETESLGLFYPPDPGSAAICTIGGNVAENAGGIRGLKYGVTKEYVMGLEVCTPTGEIIKTGGKVVKDVAGYNLKDLFVGSEGTLGIITKILLKLIPYPEKTKTILVYFSTLEDAATTVSGIIAEKILPSALEFLDRTTIKCVEDFAHLGLETDIEALLLIEVDGYEEIVEKEASKIFDICKKNKCGFIKIAENHLEAEKLRAARKVAFSALARVKPTTILEDATVPRSEIAKMIVEINRIAKKHNVVFGIFGHAGDGNLHPTCLTDERNIDEIKRAEEAFEEIFDVAISLGGTITGEHGIGLSKKKFLSKVTGNDGLELMMKIKEAIDPNIIMNPGKIFSFNPTREKLRGDKERFKKFILNEWI